MPARTFTAVGAGPMSTAGTWDLNEVPTAIDNIDCDGFALTQGTISEVASLTDTSVGNTATLTLTGNFKCVDVSEVPIIVPDTKTALIDFGDKDIDPGCSYSGAGNAIECKTGGTVTDVTGKLTNSGSGCGAFNSGQWDDFSGDLINSGSGIGVNNGDTWSDFSGLLTNTSSSYGFYNDSTLTDFSGLLTNTGAVGGFNSLNGTWTDLSGLAVNSHTGMGLFNDGGTWSNFTGALLNLGAGGSFEGVISGVTGSVGNKQGIITTRPADCLAANILTGKTILGVAGTGDMPNFGPYPSGSTSLGPYPVNADAIGPYPAN